jgi:hypothetical protein
VLVPGGGPNAEAAAAVLRAVNGTLADKTAHVALDMQVRAGAVSMTGSGSGVIDMNQNAMQVQLSMAARGQSLDVQVIYLAGTVYEGVPGLSQLEPGKSWVALDLSALTQSSPSPTGVFGLGNNPAAMLRMLAQRGSTVTPLGGSTVDGTAVEGYAVTISRSEVQAELANTNLPDWIRQSVSKVDIGDAGIKVYVDGQGLLRRMGMSMQVSYGTGTVAVSESLTFSDYGSAVSVSAPPSDQVIGFQQFVQDAAAQGAGQTSS